MKLIVQIFISLVFLSIAKGHAASAALNNTCMLIKSIDSCVENLFFKSNYLKSLQYIEGCVEGRETSKKKFGNCIDNMVRNSGIKSSVYYGYIFRYRKKTDFYADKKNGCHGMREISVKTYAGNSLLH
ncbi:hypothetical protein [Pedobacter africanus]|uniref:Cysteine rich repeat-containing protein n=1 Tax=Pedobacter africanus TaxID=151894 RepID=A0A1W2BR03_9SPHI|nr:hypothetical protein [Pedobacter africanus]SMC75353.1 hypothetical protein SAMN04488524_2570 [Pedobacter africanus]